MFANFWWLCHFWQLFVTFVILLFYCPVMMSSCHIVIFTSCHSVLLSSCQSGILSICQFVNFPASELLSLRTFWLAHLRACELVLHIIKISFGGFLAECLPCLFLCFFYVPWKHLAQAFIELLLFCSLKVYYLQGSFCRTKLDKSLLVSLLFLRSIHFPRHPCKLGNAPALKDK